MSGTIICTGEHRDDQKHYPSPQKLEVKQPGKHKIAIQCDEGSYICFFSLNPCNSPNSELGMISLFYKQ